MAQSKNNPVVKLDSHFWQGFHKNIWQKNAVVIKNVSTPLLQMDADYVFNLLVDYSARCRKLKTLSGLKFFVDGQRQYDEDVLQILPIKKDKSFVGYHARMNKLFSDYCLVCDELLQVNKSKKNLLTSFTDELYKHVGFPNRFSEMGLYIGNYKKTPFGVHVDACDVFSFPVVGTKNFRIWKPDYIKKNKSLIESHSYEKHKKNSLLLTAQPTDMIYWPSSAWHIAESDGSFSSTWSLGVWVDKTHAEVISEVFNDIIKKELKNLGQSKTTKLSANKNVLPEIYKKSAHTLSRLTKKQLETEFLKSWKVLISKQGLKK